MSGNVGASGIKDKGHYDKGHMTLIKKTTA